MSFLQQTHHLQTLTATTNLTTLPRIPELYQNLIDNLTQHNHLYYVQAQPIISDTEYDQLFDFLKRIEEEFPYLISSNSPTQSLIGQIAEGFEKADHTTHLLSLENSYDAQDLIAFDERVERFLAKQGINRGNNEAESEEECWKYKIEPKYDGVSVELIYENGEFTKAITRGDGITGEDISLNAKTITNLPKVLPTAPAFLSVRGEIMMPKSVRKTLNQQREKEGKEIFANTRNAAAGSIKLLDSGEVAKRGLVCFIYECLTAKNENGDSIECDIALLGFPTVDISTTEMNITQVKEFCLAPETKHSLMALDFDFDGLVIKISNTHFRQLIGSTNHHPRRAIAYKFPAEQASTQILSIDFQVGRSGIITPVANLEPIKLSGVEISRVSLHNFDFIKKKEIKQSDFVRIQRSGEVIPYITSVIKDRRSGTEALIEPPLFCPVCQALITNLDIHYYCTNPNCSAQVKEKILHFVSKDAMDIQGIGESVVEVLVNKEIFHNIADIYKLEDPQMRMVLRTFPGFGDKRIYEISRAIKTSKKQPFWRVLNALGIPNIGIKTAQDITTFLETEKVNSLEMLQSIVTDTEKMVALYGIGEKTVLALQNFFSNPQTQTILEQLQHYGISFSAIEHAPEKQAHLGSFSLTGVFPFPKEKIREVLEGLGYTFHAVPTKHTSFVLIGEKAGNKVQKAIEYQLQTYSDWEEITKIFPTLKELKVTIKQKPILPTAIQTSLF